MTTHFSSPDRVLRRRKGALKRFPKVAKSTDEDYAETHPNARTQAQLDAERQRLEDLISGNYQKKTKKAWKLDQ